MGLKAEGAEALLAGLASQPGLFSLVGLVIGVVFLRAVVVKVCPQLFKLWPLLARLLGPLSFEYIAVAISVSNTALFC